MPNEPDRPRPSDGESEEEPLWDGMPLELESGAGPDAGLPVGEETVSRPLSDLVSRAVQPTSVRWLSPWLMLGGVGGAVLALASVACAVLQGGPVAGWRGGLLAFDAAVILLIVRAYLVAGTPTLSVCHRVFSTAGLAAAGYVVVAALLQSAQQFIQGEAPHGLLSQFLTLELLGIAGCIVFVQCLRGRGWACRAAAVAAVAFLATLIAHGVRHHNLMGWSFAVPVATLRRIWPGLVGVGCSSLGLALCWDWARRRSAPVVVRLAVAGGWLLVVAGAAAFVAHSLGWRQSPEAASRGLWQTAVLWESAIVLPLVLAGLLLSWRRRQALATDVVGATRFAWLLVALAGIGCILVWVVARPAAGVLESVVLLTGVGSLVAGAWIGATAGDWPSRWALIPAIIFTLVVLCSLGDLLASAWPQGPAWAGAIVFLWCCLVVSSGFATAGLAVQRRRVRLRRRRAAMWGDVHLFSGVGILGAALLLGLMFAFARGDAQAVQWLRTAAGEVGAHLRDLLTLAGGKVVSGWLSANVPALGRLWSPWIAALAAGLLFAALCVHLLASSQVRDSLYLMAALWWLPLLAFTALVVGVASHLFSPPQAMTLETPALDYMAGHFPARAALTALLVALLVRGWESFVSVMRLSGEARRGAAPEEGGRESRRDGLPADPHLIFLVRSGVVISGVLLATAFLACPFPSVRTTLARVSELTLMWLGDVGRVLDRVGLLAARWSGHAIATGLMVYLLVALCVSGRRRRSLMLPLLVVCWVLLLGYLFYAWFRVVSGAELTLWGYLAMVAVTGLPMLGLLGAALWSLVAWARSARGGEADSGGAALSDGGSGAAFGLSSVGLLACVAAAVAVLAGALPELAGRPGWTRSILQALERGWHVLAGMMRPLLAGLAARGSVGLFAGLLVLGAGLLVLHMLARHGTRGWRAVLCAVWSAPVLVGIGGAGYVMMSERTTALTGPQLVLILVVMLLLLRVVVALLNARWWLSPSEGG